MFGISSRRMASLANYIDLEWGVGTRSVQHIIHACIRSHAISAWHMHELQTDHIFPINGLGRLVLFL